MANLIITIISIALVAIVAIAGIYYGGQAYNGYQIQAETLRVRNIMEQIAAGAKLYEADTGKSFIEELNKLNGNTTVFDASQYSINQLLIPKYVQPYLTNDGVSDHVIPIRSNPVFYEGWLFIGSQTEIYSVRLNDRPYYLRLGNTVGDMTDVKDQDKWRNICKTAAKMARGKTALPLVGYGQRAQAGPFDCEDQNGDGNVLVLLYRL